MDIPDKHFNFGSMVEEGGNWIAESSVPVKRNGPIVLFGEILADIFPDRTVLGGAPFNVARHLKAFGQAPVLITRLGNDALRDEVVGALQRNDMETVGIQRDKSHPTGRVQVRLDDKGHRFDILPQQAYDFIHPGVARITALSVNPALVYFGTLAQRCDTSRRALKTLLRSSGAAKFLDINLRPPWYSENTLCESLQHADIVKMNDEELDIVAGMFKLHGGEPQDRARELIARFGLEQVLVTCGSAGAWQINRNGKVFKTGAADTSVTVVDTVGAGDGFSAVFILGALRKWPMARTLERANAFASALCGIRGAIPGNADFYAPFVAEWGI